MRALFASTLLFLSVVSILKAAEAAFSEDAGSIYIIHDSSLEIINLSTTEVTSVDAGGIGEIDGICRAGNGAFYLISENALWRWKPGPDLAELVVKADANCSFDDVACSDDRNQVVITGTMDDGERSSSLLVYQPMPGERFLIVRTRHLNSAVLSSLEFLPDGTLVFSADWDVWHGELGVEPMETEAEEKSSPIASLTAYRYAPIAERLAYPGSPAEQGVNGIVFGAGNLFVHVSRIGGSGWGHLSKMAAPPSRKDHEFPVKNKVADSLRVLASVKELFENGSRSFLCASPDRKLVYMTNGSKADRTHYLAEEGENRGEPVAFRIGDKVFKR